MTPIVLFDLDGTLVRFDWERPELQPQRQQVFELAVQLGVSAPRGMMFPALLRKGREHPELLRAIVALEDRAASHAIACADAAAVLAQLRPDSYTLALVTNNGTQAVDTALRSAAIAADRFAAMVCRDHVSNAKPDPEPLRHALNLLHPVHPAPADAPLRVVVIGDAVTDVQAARALQAAPPRPLQLHVFGVTTGMSSASALAESGADAVLQSLAELPERLRLLPTQ